MSNNTEMRKREIFSNKNDHHDTWILWCASVEGYANGKEQWEEVTGTNIWNDCSIRIGVNAGSLEKDILEKYKEPCPEALVESALRNIKVLEDQNFFNFKVSLV